MTGEEGGSQESEGYSGNQGLERFKKRGVIDSEMLLPD